MSETYSFTVNGVVRETGEDKPLLRYLRDDLRLTSCKDGCSEGACGTCTVLIDGKPTRACIPQTDKLEGKAVLIVTAGDAKVDNGKYKAQFHTKAKMLTHEEAHDLIGHDVGGVCPFALPEDVNVYLDVSLKRFETVYPAAGSSNSAIELTCGELEQYSSNFMEWVDVCKAWE